MKFKYLIALLVALALATAACGSSSSDEAGESGSDTAASDDDATDDSNEEATDTGSEGDSEDPPADGEPIKIGVIADLTGPFTLYGTSLANSTQLAVDEINAAGGIDGRQIDLITEDIQTDVSVTVDRTRFLLESEDVDLIIGPIGSDANDAAFQAITGEGDTLHFYPETYEGGKCDANFFSFGAVPAQQVRPLIPLLQDEFGPNAMLFGADYVWPERTFEIARPIIEENGGTVVSELYLPLVADDFTELVNEVRDNDPDYILTLYPAIWGAALKALDDAGLLTDDLGVGTTFMGDPDLAGVGALAEGDYTALPLFTSVDSPAAQEFVTKYSDAFGDIPSGGEAVGSYNAVYMYKAAVENAGSTDADAVGSALVGQTFDGPTGTVTMTDSHHLSQTINLAQAGPDGTYSFVSSFEAQDPEEAVCG